MAKTLRVLVVCSGNKGRINPFISEQVDALTAKGVHVDYFVVQGKGIFGYLKNYFRLKRFLRNSPINIIHAHYGLCGLLATLQRKVPVVTTFHGSDVNVPRVLRFSKLAARRSAFSIVVEKSFLDKLDIHSNVVVLPCGINLNTFVRIPKVEARMKMNLNASDNLVLFTSAFANPVKNYPLAEKSMKQVDNARLLELKGYSREQINLLMNAADVLLVTSFSEGSPQVVKEALACDLPVVSTPVGDVDRLLAGIAGTYIVPYEANQIAKRLQEILANKQRLNSRDRMKAYDNTTIAEKLIHVYKTISRS
jgi:teichuronic acid biosynthesis glycosyltransferase TuaC